MSSYTTRLARELSLVLSAGIGDAEEFIAGPDRDGIAGGIQTYARRVCRIWGRTPGLTDQGRILGYDTVCTPYLQTLGEVPVPGSITNQTFGTLRYRIWDQVAGAYSPTVFEATVRADYSLENVVYTGAPPPEVSNFPACNNPNGEFVEYASWGQLPALGLVSSGCGGGQAYANSLPATGRAVLVVEFIPDGTPIIDVVLPTPQPNLPPLSPPPIVVEGPFGSVDVDIELLPDGRITLFGPELDITIDPFGDGERGGGLGDNNRLPSPNSSPEVPRQDGEDIEPPEGERLVAVGLSFDLGSQVPRGRVYAVGVVGVDAYFPRVGRVLFEIASGQFEGPYDIQLERQILPVQFPGGATRAIFELPPGVIATVTGYSLIPDASGGEIS